MNLILAILLALTTTVASAAPCSGKFPCKVCTNCKKCRHCNPHRAPSDPRPKPTCGTCHPIFVV